MTKIFLHASGFCTFLLAILSCNNNQQQSASSDKRDSTSYVEQRLAGYVKVKLSTDLSKLTEKEKQMLPLLIQAAEIMDELFWRQVYDKKDSLLKAVRDEKTRQFIVVNYGPWDRLNNDTPFVAGVGAKPLGATFIHPI